MAKFFQFKNIYFRVALGSIRAWLEDQEKKNDVDIIILCRFENEDKDVYDKYLHKYFPVKPLDD